jgi:fatty-acyl-CoA synthase
VSAVSPFWPPGEPHTLPLPEGVLYDALVRAATARPDHPATLFYGGVVTYAELLRQVDALAGYLQNICGVKRGDRVMVALQNSPQYVISYYAVMRADAVVVPINPMNKTAELDYIASDSGAGWRSSAAISSMFLHRCLATPSTASSSRTITTMYPRHRLTRCRPA